MKSRTAIAVRAVFLLGTAVCPACSHAATVQGCAATMAAAVSGTGNSSHQNAATTTANSNATQTVNANSTATDDSGGYRVVQDHWDTVIGVHWVMVEECGHPERPPRTVALNAVTQNAAPKQTAAVDAALQPENAQPVKVQTVNAQAQNTQTGNSQIVNALGNAPTYLAQPVLVHFGDTVVLWSKDDLVQVVLRATAEQSGRAGETIWLHLNTPTEDQDQTGAWQRRRGIVRDTDSVEMLP